MGLTLIRFSMYCNAILFILFTNIFHLVKIAHQWCLHEIYLAVVSLLIEYSVSLQIKYIKTISFVRQAPEFNFVLYRGGEISKNKMKNWRKKIAILQTITKWKWRIQFVWLFGFWSSKWEQKREKWDQAFGGIIKSEFLSR